MSEIPLWPRVHTYADQYVNHSFWDPNAKFRLTAYNSFYALSAQLCWSARNSFGALSAELCCLAHNASDALGAELCCLAHNTSDALSAHLIWSVQNYFDTPNANYGNPHTIILIPWAHRYAHQHTILFTHRAEITMISTRLFWHPERTITPIGT